MSDKAENTLKLLEDMGIDTFLLPDRYKAYLCGPITDTAFGHTLEIGFLLPENIQWVKELQKHLPALKVVTSKPELFALRLKEGDDHVGFTHINSWWADNIFYCLYALPVSAVEQLRPTV